MRYSKTKPIEIEAKRILKKFFIKILLNENNLLLLKNINKIIELNQDEMDVAIGIIINPISLK